ncbi:MULTISPECIES: DNA repair protein RecN [unclassified Motilimonas]|uniref:DNA repair protein RecN n=1 Tax=Motilimonas TaxID=1914248 RepID=UPI001E3B5833|nr:MULTISPECIES: DNA repair protein RecN [unclassified Motilimonas]MCE0558712.1 DNA repair protein RecN [Motilimonas sp. E26]MDO6525375.1 DNA repair protein RecN [Motilimonas sp. 1_MG-2023]
MLTQLTVTNFAIVKFLELELSGGMTSITGETGAGKSIAIDALGLCLGDRADAHMVRPGAKKAEIIARFSLQHIPAAQRWLQDNELENENDCILRRTVTHEGRSRGYINGIPVPLSQLKNLGQLLVHIHGQHAHQTLLRPDVQMQLLDGYAGHKALLRKVKDNYQGWQFLNKELRHLQQQQAENEARKQLLEYQVQELDEFALQPNEFEEIEQEHKKLANSGTLMEQCQAGLDILYENDEVNALSLLQMSANRVESQADNDPALSEITSILQEAIIQVEEASSQLRNYCESLEMDPEQFNYLDNRLSQAMQLARKHQVPPEELCKKHQELAKELDGISNSEERAAQLEKELANVRASYLEEAKKLSQSRQRYAEELSQKISESMHQLSMPSGQFLIDVLADENAEITSMGIDTVNYSVTTNPGQPLQSIGKVASGGELSRISLALQVITSQKASTPTMIFDEVDVGISGATASVVGKLLRKLGETTQVFCVTHLPQVAGHGHQQMFVSKETDGTSTQTSMHALKPEQRLEELARLLGGDAITEKTLANAQELLIQ